MAALTAQGIRAGRVFRACVCTRIGGRAAFVFCLIAKRHIENVRFCLFVRKFSFLCSIQERADADARRPSTRFLCPWQIPR